MLKKQTVWLLTMLSLLIVLSVYYIVSDNDSDLAFIDQERNNENTTVDSAPDDDSSDAEVTDITNITSDELFTTIRLELEDDRSMEKSRLEAIVASGTASMEEKNNALEGIDALESMKVTERILEESIISQGYEDVLVRNTNGDKVHVHVRADELSHDEALAIMQMVRDEFNQDIPVDVNYQAVIAK